MKTKFIIPFIALLMAGCATSKLEPGGAYAPVDVVGNPLRAPDYSFFVADSAYGVAHGTINGAFEFERNNRAMLWTISPDIKHTLDKIRPQAVEINAKYLEARAIYLANPIPANLTKLQELLARIQSVSKAVVAVLPTTPKAPVIQ